MTFGLEAHPVSLETERVDAYDGSSHSLEMKLLDETAALDEVRNLLAQTQTARLAVAFWGKGAIERLGLSREGLKAEILCNLDSGACNPAELRRILGLPDITLKSHPSLHAKVYWTPSAAVLGSSNASANGLALEGQQATSWREANIRLNDPEVLGEIATWFDGLFNQGYEIGEEHLGRAELIWNARARSAPSGTPLVSDLLTAYDKAPAHPAWSQVKLAYWKDYLAEEDQAWLEAEHRNGSLSSAVSAYGEWNDYIFPNDWVLDFDLRGRSPKFGGIWSVLAAEAARAGMRLVRPVKQIEFAALGGLTLAEKDAARLAKLGEIVLAQHSVDGRNAVIDLSTAVGLMQAVQVRPNEKAFRAAMEQLYKDARKIGYRSPAFRKMLDQHGGVDTARRLIRGQATSGFATLLEKGRLDLSAEALILQPRWRELFYPEELAMAEKRLREVGYFSKP
ncbi:phospholipase D family protein [Sandarakinorhabdus rubra]|uniref:phospholipase D family protein n=1 Tax=Sandarakinorhabdus rubra TaxID=2672568 RepID=UPI0013DCD6A9|nr:phospholipase D family protein [Sandarakinorhabdus rubra]